MELVDWRHLVILFTVFSCCLLLWRLWSQGLARIYLFLTLYLAGDALQSIAVFPMNSRSQLYGWFYFASNAVLWIFAYFVVLELYRLTFEEYPGIAGASRKAVSGCMGLAVLISVIYAVPGFNSPSDPSPILHAYKIADRSVALALLLFLVLIQLFLFHYKIRLSPNRILYATGYGIYFALSVGEDILWTALGVRLRTGVSLWILAAANIILLAGAALLNREGEARAEIQPAAEDADRILLHRHLTEMNRLLTRAARRSDAVNNS